MRGQLLADKLPTRVINNKVLVLVVDTFAGFTSKGGIQLVNLTEEDSWGDSHQFNISEFAMRHGTVVLAPEIVTKGSFNYETEVEIQSGDEVFWNLVSFQTHIPIVHDRKVYLLVDYHEILARKRNDEITPINGYGLFTPVAKETKALLHVTGTSVSDEWVLYAKPQRKVKYDRMAHPDAGIWLIGEKVKLLVGSFPFKLEGTINTSLDTPLYACPMNYVICTC